MQENKDFFSDTKNNTPRIYGYGNGHLYALKTKLAQRIIDTLDHRQLSLRQAQDFTGYASADFFLIRNRELQHFTLDHLMAILNALDSGLVVQLELARR